MIRTSCALSALVLFLAGLAQPHVKPYRVVGGGSPIDERAEEVRRGYYRVVNLRSRDTLWAWFEHVDRGETPDYESAKHADLVVWCYPQEHPHERHVFPGAKGRIWGASANGILYLSTDKTIGN